jgi:hypothetical protein
MTNAEAFDKYGDEICKVCKWHDEPHGINVLCEGSCCEYAVDLFLDGLEEEKPDWREDVRKFYNGEGKYHGK